MRRLDEDFHVGDVLTMDGVGLAHELRGLIFRVKAIHVELEVVELDGPFTDETCAEVIPHPGAPFMIAPLGYTVQ